MSRPAAHYPGRATIDAYGNILCLPSGMYAWDVRDPGGLSRLDFEPVFAEKDQLAFLLVGTGRSQVFPSLAVRRAFDEAGLGLEVMDTGAACRTYNVLLAEQRPVAAALIAVD